MGNCEHLSMLHTSFGFTVIKICGQMRCLKLKNLYLNMGTKSGIHCAQHSKCRFFRIFQRHFSGQCYIQTNFTTVIFSKLYDLSSAYAYEYLKGTKCKLVYLAVLPVCITVL